MTAWYNNSMAKLLSGKGLRGLIGALLVIGLLSCADTQPTVLKDKSRQDTPISQWLASISENEAVYRIKVEFNGGSPGAWGTAFGVGRSGGKTILVTARHMFMPTPELTLQVRVQNSKHIYYSREVVLSLKGDLAFIKVPGEIPVLDLPGRIIKEREWIYIVSRLDALDPLEVMVGQGIDRARKAAYGIDLPIEFMVVRASTIATFGVSGSPVFSADTGELIGVLFGYERVGGKRYDLIVDYSVLEADLGEVLD